jgi:release factor glutamine methyltransferase
VNDPGSWGDDEGTVSWRELRDEAHRRLREAGLDDAGDPALDARRLVERASGEAGAALLLALDRPATRREVGFFDQMLERRLTGEPLQYVLGTWSFRSLDLLVDRRVLIPRPETEQVVEVALGELDRRRSVDGPGPRRVADLGTGSGAIGLAIAVERPGVEVWLTDVSPDALAVARANLAGLGRAGTRVRIAEGRWFEALPDELVGGLDVVVSNPPYVAVTDELPPVVRDWEPATALFGGEDGLDHLRELVAGARRWLAPGGALVVESAPSQTGSVAAMALGQGFSTATVVPDLAGRSRAVVARR